MQRRPAAADLDHITLVVADERKAAGDQQTMDELPLLGPETDGFPTKQHQFGRRRPQQPGSHGRLGVPGGHRIERIEAKRRVVVVEGVVECASALLVLSE